MFPGEPGEPPCKPQGGSPFSLGEGQTFKECGLFLREKKESRPGEHPGETCEGPAEREREREKEREKERERERERENVPVPQIKRKRWCSLCLF